MTVLPVLSLVKVTVPLVELVDWTVTVMVFPEEIAKLEKSVAKLGNLQDNQ